MNTLVELICVICFMLTLATSLDNHFDIYRIHTFIKARSDDKYFTDEMNQYGCWCGQTGRGNPVDDLDRCCLQHNLCLNNILTKGCEDSSQFYQYASCFSITYICTDKDSCKQMYCKCDVELADCLFTFKFKYDKQWKYGNKAYCITT